MFRMADRALFGRIPSNLNLSHSRNRVNAPNCQEIYRMRTFRFNCHCFFLSTHFYCSLNPTTGKGDSVSGNFFVMRISQYLDKQIIIISTGALSLAQLAGYKLHSVNLLVVITKVFYIQIDVIGYRASTKKHSAEGCLITLILLKMFCFYCVPVLFWYQTYHMW